MHVSAHPVHAWHTPRGVPFTLMSRTALHSLGIERRRLRHLFPLGDLYEFQDIASWRSEPASLQQRNKEAVLQFLMAIQFQHFAELSAVTFACMTARSWRPAMCTTVSTSSRS